MANKQRHRYKKMIPKDAGVRRTQSDVSFPKPNALVSSPSPVRASRSEEVIRHQKKLDRYGFIINMDNNGQVYDDGISDDPLPTFAETQLTERRERKWSHMMQSWELVRRRRRRLLSKRLRKGIPESMRGTVWPMLANVSKKMTKYPGKYDAYVRSSVELVVNGTMTTTSSIRNVNEVSQSQFKNTQDTIERDIHRTYPRHSLFHDDHGTDDDDDEEPVLETLDDEDVTNIMAELDELDGREEEKAQSYEERRWRSLESATGGQASLRRVLKAYSVRDQDVGYCQGMNFIAGMFLTFMSEEESFWLLTAVMNDEPCQMRGLFGEGMMGTLQVLHVAEKLTWQFLPRLAKHFEKENIEFHMFATQWLLTVYTSSFQFDLVTRVWDIFLGEGWKICYRVMLALLQDSESSLLKLRFEDILAYFRDLPENTRGDYIVESALKIPLRRKHIEKYKKEWVVMRQQQQQRR